MTLYVDDDDMYRWDFADLVARKIVPNRPTLSAWIKKGVFPPGKLLGPNKRSWSRREIREYIDARPSELRTHPNIEKAEASRQKTLAAERAAAEATR